MAVEAASALSSKDFIALIFLVGVFMQAFRDRRWWIGLQGVTGVVGAVIIILPAMMTKLYNVQLDELYVYLFRIIGCYMLAFAVTIFAMEQCEDKSVPVALSTSRILFFTCMAFLKINTFYFQQEKNGSTLPAAVSLLLLILYDIINMPRLTREYGSLTVGDPLSLNLTFDFFIEFVIGILLLAFPDMFLYTVQPEVSPTAMHCMFVREIGAYYLGSSISSLCALSFKNTDDVENLLKCKLLTYGTIIFSILISMYHNEFITVGQIVLMLGTNGLLAANSYVAVNNIPLKID